MQKNAIPLTAILVLALAGQLQAQSPEPLSVAGDWQGVLEYQRLRLRVAFHITREADGLTATMDSPDQGAFGIPVGPVTLTGDTLEIAAPVIQGRYRGVLRGDTLRGTWTQGPARAPLVLVRGDAAAMRPNRPQEPAPPYPYDAIDVTFENAEAGITLAGTLTRPKGDGPFPAVVLLSGSGPQDRDEMIAGHKPFLVLADHLTRRGIAVLRFDDRGVGGSTGDFAAATTADFATDARAAVRYLRSREDIDPARIGLAGHSEGGVVASMAAAGSDDVAFLVLLAPPGVPLDSLLPVQFARIARAGGVDDALIASHVAWMKEMFAIRRAEPDPEAATARMREAVRARLSEATPAERELLGIPADDDARAEAATAALVDQLNSPWMRFIGGYDPTADLRRLSVPVLAIAGTRDLQVPPDVNLPPIERALREAGNPDFEVRELPGLNHLLQPAATGSPVEYGRIETTIAPETLDLVAAWIAERVARP